MRTKAIWHGNKQVNSDQCLVLKQGQKIRISANLDLINKNLSSDQARKDLLIVNHPKDIAKQLHVGQKAHINYTEAALSVVGFESEKEYLQNT